MRGSLKSFFSIMVLCFSFISSPSFAEEAKTLSKKKTHTSFHHRHKKAFPMTQDQDSLKERAKHHANEAGVPFELANAVIIIESRYNPHVSNRGALGLMQIKLGTARGMGFEGSSKALMEVENNLRFGMRYLAAAYHASKGDICETVMRYQSGFYATHFSAPNRIYCSKARNLMAGKEA